MIDGCSKEGSEALGLASDVGRGKLVIRLSGPQLEASTRLWRLNRNYKYWPETSMAVTDSKRMKRDCFFGLHVSVPAHIALINTFPAAKKIYNLSCKRDP